VSLHSTLHLCAGTILLNDNRPAEMSTERKLNQRRIYKDIFMTQVKSLPKSRFSYRYPRTRKSREALKLLRWTVAAHLLAEGLPIPEEEELDALTARWVELSLIVAGDPSTRQDPERGRAFMREFLHLACTPASTTVSPEAQELKEA
jgi:hypothetical protein